MENENLNEQLPEMDPEIAAEVCEELPAEECVQEVAVEPVVQPEEPVVIPDVEAPKSNTMKIVLISIVSTLLAVALIIGVLYGAGLFKGFVKPTGTNEPPTTIVDPTVEGTTEEVPTTTENLNLKSYTVSDEEAVAAAGNVVASVGDLQLQNDALQVCYWTGMYEYYSQFGYYLYMMGVDFSKPLDTLVYDQETNKTWQEFLLEYSLSVWHQYAAINHLADAEGFEMTQEQIDYMAEMDQYMEDAAKENGFATTEELVKAQMGAGASLQGYKNYTDVTYRASCYMEAFQNSLQPTDEELDAFFTENAEKYAESQITKESGNVVDVRHLLVMPTGGTEGEDGTVTYSEEEWEACRVKAQELYDQWLAGDATEDSFAALATANSEDTGSVANGGLYSNVTKDQMVPEFDSWIFDASRAYGDHGLVKTTYGYHIMFFVKAQPQWLYTARKDYVNEKIGDLIQQALEDYPMETNYDNIVLSEINLG